MATAPRPMRALSGNPCPNNCQSAQEALTLDNAWRYICGHEPEAPEAPAGVLRGNVAEDVVLPQRADERPSYREDGISEEEAATALARVFVGCALRKVNR